MTFRKMNNSELVQIADILPPTTPVSAPIDSGIYFFLLMIIVAAAVLWSLRSSKQKLKRLRKKFQQGKIDNRQCAFQLAGLLGPVVNTATSSAQKDSQHWQEYISALQLARYSRRGLANEAMTKLLREAERWL